MERNTFLAATAAAGVFLSGGFVGFLRTAAADEDRATGVRQLVGSRYDTMLALALYLDETAQGALEGAADDVRRGGASDARFLSVIRAFAASTSDLRRSMGDSDVASLALPSQVADLAERASVFGARIRAAGALASIYDEWDAITDVLQRMTLLLAGQDVAVPTAYVLPALTGPRLAEIRRLASDLDLGATRNHDAATRAVGRYPDRGEQFLGELRHFAALSRDLQSSAATGKVDPQGLGVMVDHLLEEARQADRRMRDAEVFTEVWDDSARAITILSRMASLVRS